eukprot:4892054-Pleurochrysis_carterae.AAC.2
MQYGLTERGLSGCRLNSTNQRSSGALRPLDVLDMMSDAIADCLYHVGELRSAPMRASLNLAT